MRKPIVRAALLLLAATPAAFSLWIIRHYSVDFHMGDEWDPEIAGIYIKAASHQLTFGDLVSFHNEHRLLIPRLLYLLLNVFTKWNSIAELVGGWVIFLATSIGVLWLMHEEDGEKGWLPRPSVAGRWLVCNVLLFDPAQYENWLSGWGLANALPGALTIAAIMAARSAGRSWARLALCILLAAGATYSNGCGFLAWIAAGIVMAWSESWAEFRAKWAKLIVAAAVLAILAGFYFRHYQPPAHVNPYQPSISKMLGFVAIYVGNPFMFSKNTWEQMDCAPIGVVLLVLMAVSVAYFFVLWRSGRLAECGRAVVWLAVGGFGLGTAILGAAARSGYGPEQGVISRYVSFAVFMPVALVNLAPLICQDMRRRWSADGAASSAWNLCPAFLAGALVAPILVGIPRAIDSIRVMQAQYLGAKGDLLLLNVAPNNPNITTLVHANLAELTEEATALNGMGYLHPPLIADRDAKLIQDAAATSDVDGRIEGATPQGPNTLVVHGWALLPRRKRCADQVFITYQDAGDHSIILSAATMGLDRSDVAILQEGRDRRFQYCGWSAVLTSSILPPGFGVTVIKAWALDTQTGNATLLQGGLTVKQ